MAMGNFEKSEFRFSETFNNSDGKTSGSAFIGVILGLISAVTWIALPVLLIAFEVVDSEVAIEIMKQTINLVWASAALLGARKLAGSFKKNNSAEQG
jgi:F420-0:gamma-glutamyl ligase-like protein